MSLSFKAIFIPLLLLPIFWEENCSCLDLGKINYEQYNQYQLIIEGKVINIQNDQAIRKITLILDEIYKGNYANDTILIYTPTASGACGIFPRKDENWLLFAYQYDYGFQTDLCTRSKRINYTLNQNNQDLREEIQFLKEYQKKE